jgi:two-component system OmpR family sensor kinase
MSSTPASSSDPTTGHLGGAPGGVDPTGPRAHRARRSSHPPRRHGRPLRATLVALLVGTVAILCIIVGVVTHVSVGNQLHAQLDAQLGRAADRHVPPTASDDSGPSDDGPGGPGGGEYELGAVLRTDSEGGIQGSWRDSDGDLRRLSSDDLRTLDDAVEDAEPGQNIDVDLAIGSYRIHVSQSPDPSGSAGAEERTITGLPLAALTSTLHRLDLTLLVAGLAATLLTGLAGSLIVRRTLRPLEEVTTVAGKVADMPLAHGDVVLRERVRPEVAQSRNEAGDVGRALNLLLENVDQALDVRQRSEETMRRFVADASHELRTPLTAIRGYTEMLRLTEELTPRGEQSVDRMQAQSERMTALVEDLLLLARLDEAAGAETGQAEPPDRTPLPEVELGEIVVDAVMDARITAPCHHWQLDLDEDELSVHGDSRQLAQVVVNLVSNARKHTPEGTTVQVRLHRGPSGAGGAEAVLDVIDDGPGIDPSVTGDVFARFTRADTVRSGSDGTTGLGLPIVKAITEAHHGTITLDSHPGRTVFTVRLPLVG